ncbi:MAG TPA: hypothetical protein QF564_13155 [Pirellulaceae bacterium]|nr:hypothetical protein [Pirellulaceae bacterium]
MRHWPRDIGHATLATRHWPRDIGSAADSHHGGKLAILLQQLSLTNGEASFRGLPAPDTTIGAGDVTARHLRVVAHRRNLDFESKRQKLR